MIALIYKTYFKRVVKSALFLQIVVTISFAFFQAPHFLGIIKGIKFSIPSVTFMIFLRTLEWVNFITISSLIASCFTIFNADIKKFNIKTLFIQMGRPFSFMIRPMLVISCVFGLFFILIEGFCIPYGNLYLKTKLIEISKSQLVTSIQPKHIVNFKGWNFGVAKRESDTKLIGVLLNRDIEPKMTIFIKEAQFENKDYMNLNLEHGVGKIELQDQTLLFEFEEGKFSAPSSAISTNATKRNLMLFELDDINEIFKRTWMAWVGIAMPFWVFVILFGSIQYIIASSVFFVVMLFMALEIFPFSIYGFIFSGAVVYCIYRFFLKKRLRE